MSGDKITLRDFFIKCLRSKEAEYGASQNRFAWTKAIKAIREAPRDFTSPEDCAGIKGIGPVIRKFLTEQYRLGIETGSISAPAAAAPTGVPNASRPIATSPNQRLNAFPTFPEDGDYVKAFLLPVGKAFMDNYGWAFRRLGYDNALILLNLQESDLDSLGVDMPVGHRRTILARSSQIAADPWGFYDVVTQGSVQAAPAAAPVAVLPSPPSQEGNPALLGDLPLIYSSVEEGGQVPVVLERMINQNSAPELVARGQRMRKTGHVRYVVYRGPLALDPAVSWTGEVINEDTAGRSKVTVRVKENKRTDISACLCTCDAIKIDSWKWCEHIVAILDVLREVRARGVAYVRYKTDAEVKTILTARQSVIPPLGAPAAIPEPPMPTPPKKKRQRKSAAEKAAEQGAPDVDAAAVTPPPKRRKTSAAKVDNDDAENAALIAALQASSSPSSATKSKMYIPKPRSGGWAILMALSKHKLSLPIDAPYKGIPKAELLVLAQPLCDTPMEAPKGEFYGGWSSAKQLKKHGYISSYRVSHNVFFRITDTGLEVAQRCERTNQAMVSDSDAGGIMIVDEDDDDDLPPPSQSAKSPARAASQVSPKPPKAANTAPAVIDITDVDADEAYAKWLQEQFDAEATAGDAPLAQPVASSSRSAEVTAPRPAPVVTSPQSRSPSPFISRVGSGATEAAPVIAPVALKYDKHLYEIVVLVDYREVNARGSESPAVMMTNFMQRLRDNDIRCENRALELGDVLWILRPKPEALGSGGPAPLEEEIVMDCIMERKTIDDLFSSFADKRYDEQKSRLRRTLLSRVVYLVEGTLDHRHNGAGEVDPIERLLTATEALDEFLVVRTQDQFDTANVITEITKQLGRLFWNLRTPKEDLPVSGYTYAQFKKQFNKSADVTVTRAFVEQLVCLPGVSASRAQAIVERYPTPASLWRALSALETDEDRRQLISSLKVGDPPRAIGTGPATSVVNAFMREEMQFSLSGDS